MFTFFFSQIISNPFIPVFYSVFFFIRHSSHLSTETFDVSSHKHISTYTYLYLSLTFQVIKG